MEFLTSLISFGSLASWVSHPFMSILLSIDGMIFNLVSYAFNLFMLMCQLDFSSLFGIVTPIVDRLKAVIMVLVVFKLGMSFIKWMIEPESAPKEGSKLVINIFITAMFLIGYNFVFDLFNEIGMLIMGAPEGRDFVVLNQVADISGGDEGLIMRFIFGEGAQVEDIGDYLSYETMKIFIHDIDDPEGSPTVRDAICDSEKCNFNDLNELTVYLDKTVEYIWGISALVGIYLVYSIVKVAIDIGVRMFKLLILQILAPIAIITIIDGGIKSSTFQSFYKKYISVYIEAFTRMITMLLITVFVCKFFINIDSFFGPISDTGAGSMTKFLLTILVIVAAYRIGGSIPKFIDEALGTHMSGGDKKGGFGKFATGLVGSALGLAGGISAGVAAGAGGLGIAMNAASGAFNGYNSASKGNNIADFFKNTSATTKANRERAQKIARQGGGLEYARHGVENFVGVPQRLAVQSQRQADNAKAFENMMSARGSVLKNLVSSETGQKFGDSADSYANKVLEYDDDVNNAKSYYEALANGTEKIKITDSQGNVTERNATVSEIETARKEYIKKRDLSVDRSKKEYNDALFNRAEMESDSKVKETTAIYDKRVKGSGHESKNIKTDTSNGIKGAREAFSSEQSRIDNTGARQRDQRQGRY